MLSACNDLEIFDDILNGDLQPIKLFKSNLKTALAYLQEKEQKCVVTTFVKFNASQKRFTPIKYVLPHLHPLAYDYVNQESLQQNSQEFHPEITEILEEITDDHTLNQYIIIKNKKYHLIGVSHFTEWEKLNPDLLKICYFHQMLADYVKSLKHNFVNKFYRLEDDLVKRLVNRTHTRLINLCDQAVMKYELRPDDLSIQFKERYSDKDCMAIVYHKINELIDYLVNDYSFFLSSEARVPYNAQILTSYQLEETAIKTLKLIKKVKIHQDIQKVLTSTIGKLLNLDTKNRITYYEIRYYSFFITELFQFLSKNTKNIDKKELQVRLIELGFNHYEFIKHLTHQIKQQAKNLSSKEYLDHLNAFRKECEQCLSCERRIFNKELEPIKVVLNNWVKSEIKYCEYKLLNNINPEKTEKLQVDLSVSQLALMTRLFHEVAMPSKISINDISKKVIENYKTQNSASISLKSFKNNIYSIESNTIKEVKFKLIEMVNRVNEL